MGTIRYADHTDTVERKLQLLTSAYQAGRFDLAMSLADSIKCTLGFERQSAPCSEKPQIPASSFTTVEKLPAAAAQWARGWSFCKPVSLYETVGIGRVSEPVELTLGFAAKQVTDVPREIRVAQWDEQSKSLREVRSQVDCETFRAGETRCRVTFMADVDAHEAAHYLIFFGNPLAERPDYASNLTVAGEGYGLDIGNEHYLARLSRQTGQIERVTYRREHGLELYAGGKGHGEPPDIDWGHDYVDEGHFQKLRMRNWPSCPNYEVTRGPLCVQVRRWGFPYSPMHPLYTPSRMHMDITYTFYAGQPYFLKQGRMDMVQDFPIAAMRDDEWVFSGYSFTDTAWIDKGGRLHEGEVPPTDRNELWGVGFFNRTSRDSFIALRLVHTAEGFPALAHDGEPTLHYAGHGQLWSRYPAEQTRMTAGAVLLQKNAYLLSPYPQEGAADWIQQTRHRLLNPLEVHDELPTGLANAVTSGRPLAQHGETEESAGLKPAIWKVLREVKDEQFYHIDANVVDMGYVYDVRFREGVVRILLTMPHRGRPVYQFFVTQGGGRVEEGIRERLLKLEGVKDVVVDFTWNPAWTSARLTDAGRKSLGLPA